MKKYYIKMLDKINGYCEYPDIYNSIEEAEEVIKEYIEDDKIDEDGNELDNSNIIYTIYEFETEHEHDYLTSEDKDGSESVLWFDHNGDSYDVHPKF